MSPENLAQPFISLPCNCGLLEITEKKCKLTEMSKKSIVSVKEERGWTELRVYVRDYTLPSQIYL